MHSLELLKKNKIFKFDDLRQKDTGRRYMHVDLEHVLCILPLNMYVPYVYQEFHQSQIISNMLYPMFVCSLHIEDS